MKLGIYITRLYLLAIGLSLTLLVMLVVSVTLVEKAGYMARVDGGAWIALRLAMYQAVEYGYQVLPIAGLLGALVTGAILARSGELLAMQAAGLGPLRILGPCLAVAILVGLVGVAAGEWAVPWSIKQKERVSLENGSGVSALSRFYNRRTHWYKDGTKILYLPIVDNKTGVFTKPTIYDISHGVIREVIEADSMQEADSGWVLSKANIYRSQGALYEFKPISSLDLGVSARDLIDVAGNPRHVERAELQELIERRDHAGFDNAAYRLELHQRLAYPLSALWMFLLAAPWMINPNRCRSMAVNIGFGVVAIAFILALTQILRILALGHQINSVLGAWAVSFVCLLLVPISWVCQNRVRVRGSLY